MVRRSISDLPADLYFVPIHHRRRASVYQAVNKWRIRVLVNLLNTAGKLIGRLRPVVIFHSDHENGFDFLAASAGNSQPTKYKRN